MCFRNIVLTERCERGDAYDFLRPFKFIVRVLHAEDVGPGHDKTLESMGEGRGNGRIMAYIRYRFRVVCRLSQKKMPKMEMWKWDEENGAWMYKYIMEEEDSTEILNSSRFWGSDKLSYAVLHGDRIYNMILLVFLILLTYGTAQAAPRIVCADAVNLGNA